MNKSRYQQLIGPASIFAIVFAVYAYTLCPTVFWDDAGELIVACYSLGIPHPPGHPLYAMLGWLFTLIPIGSPAYRVNLMSAFFGALTCALVFQIVREMAARRTDNVSSKSEEEYESVPPSRQECPGDLIGDMIPIVSPIKFRKYMTIFGPSTFAPAVAALGAAFSLLMWDQSVVAENTTLHTFFMMLVTLLIFRIDAEPDHPAITRRLLVFSFVYGLSFTNHVAGLFFMPSLIILLLIRFRWSIFRPGRLFAMAGCFFLALALYAYLPLRSRYDPAIDWGNPENLHNFLWVVTARQYSSNLVQLPTLVGLAHGLQNLAKVLFSNLTPIGIFFSLIGAIAMWKTRKTALIYSLLVICILFSVTLNSAFISAYLVPVVLLLMIWTGYGIVALQWKISTNLSANKNFSLPQWVTYSLALLLVILSFVLHFAPCNKRQYSFAADYGKQLLSSLPNDSILITGSADPLFISWYLQVCEGFRTDVKVITRNGMTRPGYLEEIRRRHPQLKVPVEFKYESGVSEESPLNTRENALPWFANSYFKLLYELNAPRFPFFWEGSEPNQILKDRFVPYRFAFHVLPPDASLSNSQPDFLDADQILKMIDNDKPTGKVYGNHFFNYAAYHQWQNEPQKALHHYRQTLLLNPSHTGALNNAGAILFEQGKEEEAFESFLTAFRADPNNPISNHNMGQALFLRNDARKAAPFFRRTIKLNPGNFEDYHNLGLCYASMGKNADAIEMFEQALQVKPDSSEALSSLGVLYLRKQDLPNAEKYLNAAIKLDPSNSENWFNLACFQVRNNEPAQATESLKRAFSLDPKKIMELSAKDSKMAPLLNSLTQQ